jgi:diacylglycerol kinase family enzyme
MKSNTNLEIFAQKIADICGHSLLAEDKALRWTVIANPKAGGFSIAKRWKKNLADLELSSQNAEKNPPHKDAAPSIRAGVSGLIATTGAGHAEKITEDLIAEMKAELENDKLFFHLIITAGGDGTSLEVLSALFRAPGEIQSSCAVLRLPMGTGNDGADAPELSAALARIIEPSKIALARALQLTTSTKGKGPFLAFNILSVGFDAFVTDSTNKMKGRLPGDSYKLWVDVASIFYDKLYEVGPMYVTAFDEEGRQVQSLHESVLLLAVGASGNRTYGSHQHVLPDERNVCLLRQMPLRRKLVLKTLFAKGQHTNMPEANLFNASRVEFHGAYSILAQMDGEAVLLKKEDFPCAITLTEPVIQVLGK